MAQYDVHRIGDHGLVVDCQSDLIDQFDTRFVIPLVPAQSAAKSVERLTPDLSVNGQRYILATQYAASVPKAKLGGVVTSLASEHLTITAALDMLISGF